MNLIMRGREKKTKNANPKKEGENEKLTSNFNWLPGVFRQFGFMGVAIEYRLAPPHTEMNTPAHPFPGQNDIHDDGHYPEQTDDVRDAIIHYRNDPRSNGEVVVIGGSAGGSHSLFSATTGTPGYDMPDLAVLLSGGASNLTDPNGWALDCVGGEACPPQRRSKLSGHS